MTQSESGKVLEKAYFDLVMMLKDRDKLVSVTSLRQAKIILPDSIEEFKEKFTYRPIPVGNYFKKKYYEPKDLDDIQSTTLICLMLVGSPSMFQHN
jgi:hypothetical protein